MTPEQIATLPDDLLSAKDANDDGQYWDPALLTLAAQRICDLEEQLLRERASRSELADRLRQVADTDAQLMAGIFQPESHDDGCWRRHGRCAVQRGADLLDGGQ